MRRIALAVALVVMAAGACKKAEDRGMTAPAYFTRLGDLNDVLRAFSAVGQDAGKYDITVTVNGGGVTGQTEAVRLGLSRALVLLNGDWITALRKHGLLTRDARSKERKKPGLKKARKAPTYTKR